MEDGANGVNILLVGKGAREHALAWKLAQSPRVSHIYVVPGNGGTAALAKTSNVRSVAPRDYQTLVLFAKEMHVALTVVGPDDAVVDGIERYFRDSKSISPTAALFLAGLDSRYLLFCSDQRSCRD